MNKWKERPETINADIYLKETNCDWLILPGLE